MPFIKLLLFVTIGILFTIALVISVSSVIEFYQYYNSANNDFNETQETTKRKPKRNFFGKIRDLLVMIFWVIVYSIWFVCFCIFGMIYGLYDLVSIPFRKENTF